MRVAICTLGCKVNQYETQAMEQELLRRGHSLVDFEQEADAYVVNTCSVTAVSDKKSRQMLRRAKKQNPAAVVAACGCYSQTHTEEAKGLGIDLVAGSGGRMEFLDLLERAAAERRCVVQVDEALKRRDFEILPAGGMAERTRAMLKVEDGCVNFCSYCIIPYARGRVRSMPLDAAVAEARRLAAEGYREIVVNGIEISSWGQEWKDGSCLRQLLTALCAAVPDVRIRLGSLEPRTIDEAFCQELSRFPNLCPQFHLSLQSGSDTVLSRMNRKYDTARYAQSVRLLHQYFPDCAVTTDLIVGFPGESDAEFAQSLAFIRACALAKVHIFPYSRRTGTPAAKMAAQVPNAVKQARAAQAAETAAALERQAHEQLLGTVQNVLFEQPEGEFFTGHAPNYTKIYVRGDGLHNQVRAVRLLSLHEDGVLGVLLPQENRPEEK